MVKIPTPMDRRRFLKHVGILGVAGLASMTLGEIFSPTESQLVDQAAQTEIATRRKIIWDSREDAELGDTTRTIDDPKSGGIPLVNRRACAYHLPDPETGEYKEISRRNENQFCKAPCIDVCPVNAIRMRETNEGKKMPGFPQKSDARGYLDEDRDWGDPRDLTDCIGCLRCFKMCGYDTIQWVNLEE